MVDCKLRGPNTMLAITLCILLALTCDVSSHGNMKIPYNWYDTEKVGTTKYSVGCITPELPTPEEPSTWPNIDGRKNICQNFWFTNNTKIPGEQTISGVKAVN